MRGGDDFDFWDINEDLYNAIRAAELAAEGAALRARARAALLHWAALVLIGISLLLGIAMLTLPILRPWYGQAVWVFVFGFACYLLIVAVVYWSRPAPASPEMGELLHIRHQIAALHVELQRRPGARPNPVLIRQLDDAVRLLDEHLIPALQEAVERRANLQRELRRYERGEIRAPSPAMLQRLHHLRQRLNSAIEGCVQQAADAYATLIALLQVTNADDVDRRAQAWVEDLTTLYDALLDVLRGTDERQYAAETPDRTPSEDAPATGEDAAELLSSSDDAAQEAQGSSSLPDAQASREAPEGSQVPAGNPNTEHERSVELLLSHVEDALRRVRDPGQLDGCALMADLPWTVSAALRQRGVRSADATPLERAAALQQVLTEAVDRLRPDSASTGHSESATLYYHILRGQYFEGRSVRQMMTRFSVAEATYHRYRRRAIRVLTRELIEQEALARRNGLNDQESA